MYQTMSRRSARHQWFIFLCILSILVPALHAMTTKRRLELRDTAKEMFLHGWNNYMQYAYPQDELNPVKCSGRGSDKENVHNINVNDVLGDYSLTMVDTLDTLAIMGMHDEFASAVQSVLKDVSFDQDNKVQVFEVNIRALGGLLSAHILASEPSYGYAIEGYNGGLLSLAENLANRLLPAFDSFQTDLPFPRVNLRYGVPKTETIETCTAGAGSLVLEFGMLSKLTGNPHYMIVAKKAMKAIWDRRSILDLVGNVINIETGQWVHTASSTGAGVDSFFEYLLKAYILFDDAEFLSMFEQAYEAIIKHVGDKSGYLYRNVNMHSGALMATWIDSLSAFLPGLQVMHGDLDAAIKGHLVFYNIWRRFHALPERFNIYTKTIDIGFYPLRPEFIESTYYLYQATKDPFYLHVGEMIINDLNNRTRLPCGFASLGDVRTGRLEDRMESFMLSETLKYLYLLFDTAHPLNSLDSNFVFTTEGHVLLSPPQPHGREMNVDETLQLLDLDYFKRTCPVYHPSSMNGRHISTPQALDLSTIPYRPEADYAAELVGYNAQVFAPALSVTGYCTAPDTYSSALTITFGQDEGTMQGGQSPRLFNIVGGLLARSLTGLKIELGKRPVNLGGGHRVTRVQSQRLFKDDVLIVTLHALAPFLNRNNLSLEKLTLSGMTEQQHFASDIVKIRLCNAYQCSLYNGVSSAFGRTMPLLFLQKAVYVNHNGFGCRPYSRSEIISIRGKVLVVMRGGCTFYSKAMWAQQAGATAILFVNGMEDGRPIRAIGVPVGGEDQAVHIPSATLSKRDGLELIRHYVGRSAKLDLLTGPPATRQPIKHVLKLQDVPIHNLIVLMHG